MRISHALYSNPGPILGGSSVLVALSSLSSFLSCLSLAFVLASCCSFLLCLAVRSLPLSVFMLLLSSAVLRCIGCVVVSWWSGSSHCVDLLMLSQALCSIHDMWLSLLLLFCFVFSTWSLSFLLVWSLG